MDFTVSAITRPHSDIDFVVWRQDGERLQRLLVNHDYRQLALREDVSIFSKQGQRVEFYVIARNAKGQIITPGVWAHWPWPDGSFDGTTGRIGALVCPVVSVRSQLDSKESYPHNTGIPLRSQDKADIERLRSVGSDH